MPRRGKLGGGALQEDLTQLFAHEARGLLDAREISSRELTRNVLQRVEALEPRIHSFITVTAEEALEQADQADRCLATGNPVGPFTGVPVMLKDNLCTSGIRTTAGSRMLENHVPPYDAHVVKLLRSAGAVVVGKGNLDEFAMGSSNENSAFEPSRNPWDLDRVPGGSSGGPAAAVAASQVYASLGSDTGGSIRQPASLCGVVGMKPTYGLVSRYGLIAFASSLDQIGPIARDVTDCANLLSIITGHDARDSTSWDGAGGMDCAAALEQGADLRGLKIGIPREYLFDDMEPGVRGAFEAAIQQLASLGASLEETSLPLTRHALAVYYIIAPSEASANLARYDGFKYGHSSKAASDAWETMSFSRGEGFGAEVKRRILLGGYALSAGYYDAYYKKAQQVRTLIRREFSNAFERFDALVTPTSPSVAFRIGERTEDPLAMYMSDVCTIPVNIAGLPAMSVPAGFSEGLPVGLQIIGPHFGESTLLRIAHGYEQATEWHTFHPNLGL